MNGDIKKHASWKALNIKKPKLKKPKLSKPKNFADDMKSPGGPETPGAKGTYK